LIVALLLVGAALRAWEYFGGASLWINEIAVARNVLDRSALDLFALDKRTGARVGAVKIPGATGYGLSSWMHEGRQYVLVQLQDGLAAMALPGSPDGVPPAHP